MYTDMQNKEEEISKRNQDTFNLISELLEKLNKQNLEEETIPNCSETINGVQSRLIGFLELSKHITRTKKDNPLTATMKMINAIPIFRPRLTN